VVSRENNIITVRVGAANDQQAKPMAEQPNFVSALAQANKDPLLTIYVDGDNLLTQINDAVLQSENPDAQEKLAQGS